MENLLTTKDVKKVLGMCSASVYSLSKLGILSSVRIKSITGDTVYVRFKKEDVEKFISSQTVDVFPSKPGLSYPARIIDFPRFDLLRLLREKHLSIKDVALELQCPPLVLKRILDGAQKPSKRIAEKLSKTLSITKKEILNDLHRREYKT
jgi:hypothetical protein